MKQTYAWVVLYEPTKAIWGIFSSKKKAEKALSAWRSNATADFIINVWLVDYRSPRDAIKYASDTTHSMDDLLAITNTNRDSELPTSSELGPDSI
jgi:hypothetical protein